MHIRAAVVGVAAVAAATLLAPTATAATPTAGANDTCRPALAKCLADFTTGGRCHPILPVPAGAFPIDTLRPVGYNIKALRDGVYSYWDGGFMALILTAPGRRLVVVDFPDSAASNIPDGSGTRLTAAVAEALDGVTPSAIDMVYSHAHFDHIGGAVRFRDWAADTYPAAPIKVWGTATSRDLVTTSKAPRAVPVTCVVPPTGAEIPLGPHLRLALHVVGGHTADDLAIHIPPGGDGAPGIVHFVDVVFPGWVTPFTLAPTGSVGAFVRAHHAVLRLDWSMFSGGHLTRLGTRADVETSRAYVTDLIEAARKATAQVAASGVIEAAFAEVATAGSPAFGTVLYAIVNVQRRLEVDACERAMLATWGCVLGGVDIVLRENCSSALAYLIVEE